MSRAALYQGLGAGLMSFGNNLSHLQAENARARREQSLLNLRRQFQLEDRSADWERQNELLDRREEQNLASEERQFGRQQEMMGMQTDEAIRRQEALRDPEMEALQRQYLQTQIGLLGAGDPRTSLDRERWEYEKDMMRSKALMEADMRARAEAKQYTDAEFWDKGWGKDGWRKHLENEVPSELLAGYGDDMGKEDVKQLISGNVQQAVYADYQRYGRLDGMAAENVAQEPVEQEGGLLSMSDIPPNEMAGPMRRITDEDLSLPNLGIIPDASAAQQPAPRDGGGFSPSSYADGQGGGARGAFTRASQTNNDLIQEVAQDLQRTSEEEVKRELIASGIPNPDEIIAMARSMI